MYLRCAEVAPNKFEALMTGLAFDGEEAKIDGVAVIGTIMGLAAIYPGCQVELIVPERFYDLLGSIALEISEVEDLSVIVCLASQRQEAEALQRMTGFPAHMCYGDSNHN